MYSIASFNLSIISLNKFAGTPFFLCLQFVVDKQEERVNDERDHDRIDCFGNDDTVQIIQEIKVAPEQKR